MYLLSYVGAYSGLLLFSVHYQLVIQHILSKIPYYNKKGTRDTFSFGYPY